MEKIPRPVSSNFGLYVYPLESKTEEYFPDTAMRLGIVSSVRPRGYDVTDHGTMVMFFDNGVEVECGYKCYCLTAPTLPEKKKFRYFEMKELVKEIQAIAC